MNVQSQCSFVFLGYCGPEYAALGYPIVTLPLLPEHSVRTVVVTRALLVCAETGSLHPFWQANALSGVFCNNMTNSYEKSYLCIVDIKVVPHEDLMT